MISFQGSTMFTIGHKMQMNTIFLINTNYFQQITLDNLNSMKMTPYHKPHQKQFGFFPSKTMLLCIINKKLRAESDQISSFRISNIFHKKRGLNLW